MQKNIIPNLRHADIFEYDENSPNKTFIKTKLIPKLKQVIFNFSPVAKIILRNSQPQPFLPRQSHHALAIMELSWMYKDEATRALC